RVHAVYQPPELRNGLVNLINEPRRKRLRAGRVLVDEFRELRETNPQHGEVLLSTVVKIVCDPAPLSIAKRECLPTQRPENMASPSWVGCLAGAYPPQDHCL